MQCIMADVFVYRLIANTVIHSGCYGDEQCIIFPQKSTATENENGSGGVTDVLLHAT